jgi:uncharacterized protein DUF11/PASTA domain-containing protein
MRRILVSTGIALLAIAATANASTTLGTTATAAVNDCGAGIVAWGTDPGFTVPAGGGVITSMAMTAPAGGQISFKVVRGVTIVGTSSLIPVVAGVNRVAMHVPVTGGEFIGMWTGHANCSLALAGNIAGAASATDPAVGTTVSGVTSGNSSQLAVEARLEADGDHDGFGDESEDSCPTDAAIHEGSCLVDLGLTQSVSPTTIGVGDIAVALVTVANPSQGTGTALRLGATITPGLQLVGTLPSAGCVFTPALSCPLGSLAAGGTVPAALIVKGTAVGTQTVASGLTSASTDPNPANDVASTPIQVERRAAVRCVVPKLTGLPKAFAKQLLTAVNCKLGKVTKKSAKKGRRGTVIKQAKRAGTVLPVGSKVAITLRK